MIEVRNLSFTYPKSTRPAVNNVSFDIGKGQIFGFLGPNGAGKSTVQKLMIGLLPLQQGEILYDGRSLAQSGKSLFNRIGVSFEQPNLYEKLTGLENLKYYGGLFARDVIDPEQVLQFVGLGDAVHKRAGEYSKGMRQRLVFARSIMHRPDILFLDEPMAGLDPATSQDIKAIIRDQQRRGATIFLTTHNMFVAEELCNVVAFINEGNIVVQDSPRNLKLEYGERAVRVEYRTNGEVQAELLFVDKPEGRGRLNELVARGNVETLHSQEASLEQIFIRVTGRGLSA